jgi:hypothetical protein
MKQNIIMILLVVLIVAIVLSGNGGIAGILGGIHGDPSVLVNGQPVINYPTPVPQFVQPVQQIQPVQPTVDVMATTWSIYVTQTAMAQPIAPVGQVDMTPAPQPSLNEFMGNETGSNPFVSTPVGQ